MLDITAIDDSRERLDIRFRSVLFLANECEARLVPFSYLDWADQTNAPSIPADRSWFPFVLNVYLPLDSCPPFSRVMMFRMRSQANERE